MRHILGQLRSSAPANGDSQRLGPRVAVLMTGYSLSCLGSGLILPLTAIYIASYLHLGSGYAGIFFAVLATMSVLAGLMGGRLVDRCGPRHPGALGAAAMGAGYAILARAQSRLAVPISAGVVGLGTGLFNPAFTAAVAQLSPNVLRRRAFALRHLVMNAALGTGAGLAALLAAQHGSLRVLFVLNAASYAPVAAALWWAGRPRTRDDATRNGLRQRGYREVLRSRVLLVLCLTQLLIAIFGFAQFSVSVPLILHDSMRETTRLVGAVMVANTVAVVVLQYPLARAFEHITERLTLALTPLIWMVAYGSGALASVTSGAMRTALVLAFAVLFAAGEAAYSSSFYSMVTRAVSPDAVGRAIALATTAFSVGMVAGPAIGVLLVSQFNATASWLALAVAAAMPFASAMILAPMARRADVADRTGRRRPRPQIAR